MGKNSPLSDSLDKESKIEEMSVGILVMVLLSGGSFVVFLLFDVVPKKDILSFLCFVLVVGFSKLFLVFQYYERRLEES